jgi:hypothetical protein
MNTTIQHPLALPPFQRLWLDACTDPLPTLPSCPCLCTIQSNDKGAPVSEIKKSTLSWLSVVHGDCSKDSILYTCINLEKNMRDCEFYPKDWCTVFFCHTVFSAVFVALYGWLHCYSELVRTQHLHTSLGLPGQPRCEYKDNACQKDDSQNDLLLPTHLMTLVGFLRSRGKCYLIMSLAAVLSFSMLVNGHINSSDILLIFNCSAPSYQKTFYSMWS